MKLSILAVVLAVFVAGCSSEEEKIAPVVVGGKSTTEQRILVEMLAEQIEGAGLPVQRNFDMGSTSDLDSALRAGKIDVYVEYTATAIATIVRSPAAMAVLNQGPAVILDRVRAEYDPAGLVWEQPLGYDNPLALVVRGGTAALSITEAKQAFHTWRAAFPFEFQSRSDGWPLVRRVYGLEVGEIKTVPEADLYKVLNSHEADVVVGYPTDAALSRMGLRALNDDHHAFAPNRAVPVVRRASLQKYAGLESAINGMANLVTAETMRRANDMVENDHQALSEGVKYLVANASML
ncbi:MAG TPA: glycine betaine ABC transporter substrate-binding protein [Candidatus Binatia bacterium]|jgi:glycine betaine/choline ABC-type transport system substrate-binding protein